MIVEIVEALKARTASTFGGRIAGAAEFAVIEQDAKLIYPCAYVILLDDAAEPNTSDNGYKQTVRDAFAVIVLLSNSADELGKSSVAQVLQIRNVLNRALLSWQPDSEHGPIEYEGGQLLTVDRARLYWQYEYAAATEFGEADTYQAVVNAALSDFTKLHVDVDALDPYDPNLVASDGAFSNAFSNSFSNEDDITHGPDGRLEASLDITLPQ